MKASLEVEALDTRSLIIDCYRPRNASDRIAVIICDVCGCKLILSDLEAPINRGVDSGERLNPLFKTYCMVQTFLTPDAPGRDVQLCIFTVLEILADFIFILPL